MTNPTINLARDLYPVAEDQARLNASFVHGRRVKTSGLTHLSVTALGQWILESTESLENAIRKHIYAGGRIIALCDHAQQFTRWIEKFDPSKQFRLHPKNHWQIFGSYDQYQIIGFRTPETRCVCIGNTWAIGLTHIAVHTHLYQLLDV